MARDMGAAIETKEFIEAYAAQKIEEWVNEIKSLTAIAHTLPHIHGVIGWWLYLMRNH